VILSGVLGWLAQLWLPRLMLELVSTETIYSQIDYLAERNVQDAERLVEATCGPDPAASAAEPVPVAVRHEERAGPVVIGAVRASGNVRGRVLQTRERPVEVPNSEALRAAFVSTVRPYLLRSARVKSPLRRRDMADRLFDDLRSRLDQAAHPTVDALEQWCHERRELDRQARIHVALHGWLVLHLSLSTAMVILMLAHVYYAFRYW
jgi:hypothetical protein